MYNIGEAYFQGQGFAEDNYKALEWFKKAANKNHAVSCKRVGEIYDGYFTNNEINWNEALKWFKKGSDLGDNWSKVYLGEFYVFGVGGVSQNIPKAKELFRAASKSNNINASKQAKRYLQVLEDASNGKTYDIFSSNYNNKLFLGESEINSIKTDFPYLMSEYGKSLGFDVNYQVGESSYLGGMWPSRSAETDESKRVRYEDEIRYTNYSSSKTYLTGEGAQRAGLSYNEKEGRGYRAIGYMYVRAFFRDPDEKLVLKIPYIVCWKPKNNY